MLDSSRELPVTTSSPFDNGHDFSVSTLVQAFEAVLQTTYGLPPVVMIPSMHRRRGFRRFVNRLPRPRWLLRFFVVDHARTTLGMVQRRMLAAAALGHETDDGAQRQSVTWYLDSLPRYRRALYSTSLVILTIVLTRYVLVFVPGAARLFGSTGVAQEVVVIDQLLTTISAATSDISSLDELLNAFGKAPVRTVAFVLTSLSTVLYLELRSFVPAFRLKRAMFNLYPRPDLVSSTPAQWSMQRATGLYELERAVVRRLCAPPRRELPFDLIVPALLMPSVLFLGAMMIDAGRKYAQPGEPWLSYTIAAAVITGALSRLGWLTRAWIRRIRPYAGPYLPTEVRIRDTRLVVPLREPATVFWATGVAAVLCVGIAVSATYLLHTTVLDATRFLVLAFVIAPLWYRINRDLSAYLRVRDAPRSGRPELSLLAMATGGLGYLGESPRIIGAVATGWVLVSVYNTGRRIQRSEAVAGQQDRNLVPPALLVVGFIIFPVVLAHMQGAINAVWRADGDVLD